MNFNNFYLWPKKFVEDTANNKDSIEKPFVEKYTEEIFNKEIYDLEEEGLNALINHLSTIASFYTRLRRSVIKHTEHVMLERMMDEADFEAEFKNELNEILEEE
tara:strand:+ start:2391 stop:2702 length:312 start_codon:yes stop_codon:yes gene_type:complete